MRITIFPTALPVEHSIIVSNILGPTAELSPQRLTFCFISSSDAVSNKPHFDDSGFDCSNHIQNVSFVSAKRSAIFHRDKYYYPLQGIIGFFPC